MTKEDANKVVVIALTADNGCPVCVGSLLESLQKVFPDHNWKHLACENDEYYKSENEDSNNETNSTENSDST